MRWARVATLSASLAILALVALAALPTAHWAKAKIRSWSERPDPVIATPEETRAILAAVLESRQFAGTPRPPPKQNELVRPCPDLERVLVLADHSLCFGEATNSGCASERAEYLLGPELDSFAPQKLRLELVAANQMAHVVDLSGISGTRVVQASEIEKIFKDGWWEDFYKRYPATTGFVRIGQPVLTKDRQQAVIYVTHHCDGLCGSGTIHLLVRSGAGWRVIKEEILWLS